MRSHIKNYLSLTKKQWNGMVVLIILILLVLAAPYIYQMYHKDKIINFTDFNKAAAQLAKAQKADSASMLKIDNSVHEPKAAHKTNKLKPGVTIELNTADSAALTRLHGIGGSFAMRIIRYRNRLGGFYNKEQLMEVYGLDTAKYRQLKNELTVNRSAINKIDINSISLASLRQLPYLGYKQAAALIEYRNQHGKYRSVEDVRNVAIITPDIIHKIEPYITYK